MRAARRTAVALLCVSLLGGSGCLSVDLPGGVPGELVESVVHGTSGPKILMLQVEGVISGEARPSLFGSEESRVARLREELDRARKDKGIQALLLRINSPGGTVTASDILYQEIQRFQQERDIPVVAQLMGIAASGGYYVAMAADRVIAQPTTVTGSIGVLFGGVNLVGLMEKIGVENQTLTTGAYKDAGSMLRRMSPAERAQLQSVLDDMFDRFVEVVAEGREGLDAEDVRRLGDGRVYSAPQALGHGLIDAIGSLEDAVRAAEAAAGLSSSRVVSYHRPREYRENLYSASVAASGFAGGARSRWPELPSPAFLYLWTAGMP